MGGGEGVARAARRMLHASGFFQRQGREGIVESSKGKFHISTTISPVGVRYCHRALSQNPARNTAS